MSLDPEITRNVAKLARLALPETTADGADAKQAPSIESLTTELSAIVDFVEQLQEVDTTGVAPLANVAGLTNVTREDAVGTMLSTEEVLANGPSTNGVGFLVPKAVER